MTLVVTDPTRCPECGSELARQTASEPALVRSGGYGATRETVTAWCGCGWALTVAISETRPNRAEL